MAERRTGFTIVLKYAGQAANAAMGRTSKALGVLAQSSARAKAGLSDMGAGLSSMGAVGLASAGVAAFATKKYSDFANQMSAVKAVLGKDAAPKFAELEQLALKLGATTEFTATQAAGAMENLARAGMGPVQIMRAIKPVLAAASAEGMNLATAADIVASNLAAFQLPASEAARVADALAFVSAKTNTNMVQLQEGLKYAAPIAKMLGVTLEDTAAAAGVLADVGLKGSVGGTALKNALIKIAASAKQGIVRLGPFPVAIAKTDKGMLDLSTTMLRIVKTMGLIKDPLTRNKAAMKLLGLRGVGAAAGFAALAASSKKAAQEGKKGKIDVLFKDMAKSAKGAALQMQKVRLDNIAGDFTLLGSAIDGVAQAFGKALAPSIRNALGRGGKGGLSGLLSEAAIAFQHFAKNPKDLEKNSIPAIKNVGHAVAGFVKGTLLGLNDLKGIFSAIGAGIKDTLQGIGLFGTNTTEGSTRSMVKLLGVAAAVGAIGIALKTTTALFGGMAKAAMGAGKLAIAALTPLAKGAGGVIGALGRRFTVLGKFLPKGLGALGGALRGIENITAQPVRVTNFHEMALAGAPGSLLRTAAGGAGGAAAGAAGGGLRAAMRGGIAAMAGALPFGMGKLLNSTMSLKGGLLKASLSVAKFAAGAGLAAVAGWKLGTFLDKKFGMSDKVATFFDVVTGRLAARKRSERAAIAANQRRIGIGTAFDVVENMKRVQDAAKKRGTAATIAFRSDPKTRHKITRDLVLAQVQKQLAKQGIVVGGMKQLEAQQAMRGEQGDIARRLLDALQQFPKASDLKIQVKVGDQTVAVASAKHQKSLKERGGAGAGRRGMSLGKSQ